MVDWAGESRKAAVGANHPDPDQFVRQMKLESASFSEDVIYCRFVNHAGVLGIAQLHPAFHPRDLACDPYRALPYAAKLMTTSIASYGGSAKALIAYNWGSGNMANHWDGTFDDLPEETQTYLAIILGEKEARTELGEQLPSSTPRIGPDVPPDIINQSPEDWTCAIRSTYAALWILNQLGLAPARSWQEVKSGMSPRFVNSEVGLKDASGMGLVAYLGGLGVPSFSIPNLSRQRCVEELNKGNLVLIGGRGWGVAGHWALAVDAEEDGTVVIENPAPGYRLGSTPIYDFIRDSWDKTSWSGVAIEVPKLREEPVEPVHPAGDKERIEFLEGVIKERDALIADLSMKLGEAANHDGSVRKALVGIHSHVTGIESYLETLATKKAPQ